MVVGLDALKALVLRLADGRCTGCGPIRGSALAYGALGTTAYTALATGDGEGMLDDNELTL